MTFQAYIDNIQTKTGKSPADFRRLADEKGFMEQGAIKVGVKAGRIVKWLGDDFGLGHGHAMAIYAVLKGVGPVSAKTQGKAARARTIKKQD
jgi:hypothetical protein